MLSRQWKNMLYNPMLFEHQYKNKLTRPMNVTFAVSHAEEVIIQISIDFVVFCEASDTIQTVVFAILLRRNRFN